MFCQPAPACFGCVFCGRVVIGVIGVLERSRRLLAAVFFVVFSGPVENSTLTTTLALRKEVVEFLPPLGSVCVCFLCM